MCVYGISKDIIFNHNKDKKWIELILTFYTFYHISKMARAIWVSIIDYDDIFISVIPVTLSRRWIFSLVPNCYWSSTLFWYLLIQEQGGGGDSYGRIAILFSILRFASHREFSTRIFQNCLQLFVFSTIKALFDIHVYTLHIMALLTDWGFFHVWTPVAM
jgi:hypothetical protein